MPTGSAASLPLQGPLSPSSFARSARFRVPLRERGAPSLARPLPLETAAQDPPARRILVAWNDAEAALQLQRLLVELGFRVIGPAGSIAEAERLLVRPLGVRRLPVDCALVHVGLPKAGELVDRLVEQELPVVWLVPDRDAVLPAVHAYAPIVDRPFDRVQLVAAVEEAERRQASRRLYPIPPPQWIWPRVFPQL